jgi:hypothetical protein
VAGVRGSQSAPWFSSAHPSRPCGTGLGELWAIMATSQCLVRTCFLLRTPRPLARCWGCLCTEISINPSLPKFPDIMMVGCWREDGWFSWDEASGSLIRAISRLTSGSTVLCVASVVVGMLMGEEGFD